MGAIGLKHSQHAVIWVDGFHGGISLAPTAPFGLEDLRS